VGLFTSFQLKSRDADTRRRAALSLGVPGKAAAIPSLQALTADPEWAVREAAVEALGRIGDPSAIPSIIEAVRQAEAIRDAGPRDTLKAAAVAALARIGPPGVAALVETLSDKHAGLRETAIAALGGIGGPDAVAALSRTVRDDRSSVRQAGVAALARAAGAAAVPALHEALEHKDPGTRRSAAAALGSIRDGSAMVALKAALADRERAVRESVVDALAANGSPEAVAALIAGLSSADRETKTAIAARLKAATWTPATSLERAVFAALHGRFDEAEAEGGVAVEPLMIALADRDPAARRGAAGALGRLADPRAATALVALFKDTDPEVRGAGEAAAGAIGIAAADALVDALRDRSSAVRTSATAALARLGEGRVADVLMARLAAGQAARHAGRDLRVVSSRADLDAAREASDALELLVTHTVRALPHGAVRRCAELADVILIEPGEVPGSSETVDLDSVRIAAGEELTRRG
jgi:HEAT repeat protein